MKHATRLGLVHRWRSATCEAHLFRMIGNPANNMHDKRMSSPRMSSMTGLAIHRSDGFAGPRRAVTGFCQCVCLSNAPCTVSLSALFKVIEYKMFECVQMYCQRHSESTAVLQCTPWGLCLSCSPPWRLPQVTFYRAGQAPAPIRSRRSTPGRTSSRVGTGTGHPTCCSMACSICM